MRQTLTILILLFTLACFGQGSKNLGKSFVMKQNFLAQSCDAVGNNVTVSTDPLLRTFIIIIEAVTSRGYVISVPNFSGDDSSDLNSKFVKAPAENEVKAANGSIITRSQPARELYFLIPLADFDSVCEKPNSHHSFTVGIPTIPAKLRFGNGGKGEDPRYFRFEGNLSLGLSGGWKYSFGEDNKYAINTLIGFTIATVAVDSITTKGKVISNTSAASFSPHFGFVFDVDSYQFGLYSGFDFLYGEPNKYWAYRNRPWLGIGIGYSLFKAERKRTTND